MQDSYAFVTLSRPSRGPQSLFGVRSGFDDYFSLSGSLRCSSSTKFSRKMTWPEFCWVAPPAYVAATRRFPSGRNVVLSSPSGGGQRRQTHL